MSGIVVLVLVAGVLVSPLHARATEPTGVRIGPEGSTPETRAEGAGRAEHLSIHEFLELAKKSKTSYTVGPLSSLPAADREHLEDLLWPPGPEPLEFPLVVAAADGSLTLKEYPLADGCRAILADAETFFVAKDYESALKRYMGAVNQYPNCYVALSHVGDCYFFTDRFAEAIEWYDKTIALNPHDFRTYYYKGNAAYRLGRDADVRASYARALTLRPRSKSVTEVLRIRADKLEFTHVERLFTPRAVARTEADGSVGVFAPEERPDWAFYGICKGMWLAEPEHRRARTGSAERLWTSVEEVECIRLLLEAYSMDRAEPAAPVDPELERLLEIMKEGMLGSFVVYEMGARIHPTTMLLLPEESAANVEEFVKRYVLPLKISAPAKAPEAGPAPRE